MLRIVRCLCILLVLVAVSCSNKYTQVIPVRSQMLLSVDLSQADADEGLQKQLLSLTGGVQLKAMGIDVSQKLYAFATDDGLFGFVACVDSKTIVEKWMEHAGTPLKSHRGYSFSDIGNGFIAAVGSNALLVMGPVSEGSMSSVQQRMVRYLNSDSDNDITATELFSVLELTAAEGNIALAAKAKALPAMIAPLVTLDSIGSSSNVYVTATIERNDDVLAINSNIYSPDEDKAAKLAMRQERFRPLDGSYSALMTDSTAVALFVNTDGTTLLHLLRSSYATKMLMTGMNTAIDFDNIVRSIDGETALAVASMSTSNPSFRMDAKLSNTNFLSDVGYWKKSCPLGSTIFDEGHGAYVYQWPTGAIHFGADATNNDFYAYTPNYPTTATNVATAMEGHRLCMAVGRKAMLPQEGVAHALLTPFSLLFGDASAMVWRVK